MKKRLLAGVALALAAASVWTARDLRREYQGYSGSEFVEIAPGTRAPEIADLLVEKGVLRHRLPFLALYAFERGRHRLEAGEYLFDRPLRPLDVYRMLIHGEVYLHTVVLPEGSDRFDAARILEKSLGIRQETFLRGTGETSLIRDLDPEAPSLEGYLFPDTYRFPHSATAGSVISAMVAHFRHIAQKDFQSDLERSGLSLHQVVTLASLVEKETADPEERPVVAEVFELRLKKGMALQSDPTVVYAARLDHRILETITEKDLQFDSPYNTYARAGLPPGPICSPGAASIRAVLHPASTDFLYFVSNTHGGHLFARTLAEHRRNVARYRREEAALRGPTPGTDGRPDLTLPNRRNAARDSRKRPAKGVRHAKQKRDHHRLREGEEPQARGRARTP